MTKKDHIASRITSTLDGKWKLSSLREDDEGHQQRRTLYSPILGDVVLLERGGCGRRREEDKMEEGGEAIFFTICPGHFRAGRKTTWVAQCGSRFRPSPPHVVFDLRTLYMHGTECILVTMPYQVESQRSAPALGIRHLFLPNLCEG